MKIKNTSSSGVLYYFYQAYTLILILAISSLSWFFWKKGALNVNNISSVFEATIKLDEMNARSDLVEMRSFVINDRSRDAIKSFDRFEKGLKFVHRVVPMNNDYQRLSASMEQIKETLNGLNSLPNVATITGVFLNKMTLFASFVENNRWRTLTRLSSRIISKVTPSRKKKGSSFGLVRLRELYNSVNSDINIMIAVTEKSVLSQGDKASIVESIKGLKTELNMLEQYLGHLQKFEEKNVDLAKNSLDWIKAVSPALALRKINYEKNSQMLVLSVLGLIVLMGVSLFIGHFLKNNSDRRAKTKIESYLLNSIKDGILAPRAKEIESTSVEFQKEMAKLHEYAQKRMSFGAIFQKSLPFASIMLDSNLNVTWANQSFCDQWKIEGGVNKLESITWDYLQQFTNLGENDPILEARSGGVAGIYQIQVKQRETTDSLPYEMYVAPVEHNGESKIVIFFYPLRSLVETMANQTKALVGPITRTLDTLVQNNFTASFQDKVLKDFDIAGITGIFDKFRAYNDYVNLQKGGLMAEIATLENNLYDQYKLVDDCQNQIDKLKNTNSSLTKKFEDLKNPLSQTFEQRTEMVNIHQHSVNLVRTLIRECQELSSKSDLIMAQMHEGQKALANTTSQKELFKIRRQEIDDARMRLSQAIDQALVFLRTGDLGQEKLEQVLGKVKLEAKGVEKGISSLNESLASFDVSLSKMHLVMDNAKDPDLKQTKERVAKVKEGMEGDMFSMGMAEKVAQSEEEKLVNVLRFLVVDIGEQKRGLQMVEKMLKEAVELRNDQPHFEDPHFDHDQMTSTETV